MRMRCIDSRGAYPPLIEGEIYDVTSSPFSALIFIVNRLGYASSRFEAVNEEEEPSLSGTYMFTENELDQLIVTLRTTKPSKNNKVDDINDEEEAFK
jgi:hypothetical protein